MMVNDPFEAIANPVRRRIVERLAAGPRTVGSATAGLAVSKPAISRHVRVLEDARDWLDRQRTVWGRLFDAAEDVLRQEQP
jgi:DNA-binding transcriptional ArsR family regulator